MWGVWLLFGLALGVHASPGVDVDILVVDPVVSNFTLASNWSNSKVTFIGTDNAIQIAPKVGQSVIEVAIDSNVTRLNFTWNHTKYTVDIQNDTWVKVLGPYAVDVIVEILVARNITRFSRGDIGFLLGHTHTNLSLLEVNETFTVERDRGIVDVEYLFENTGHPNKNLSSWELGNLTNLLDHIIYVFQVPCDTPEWFVNYSGMCVPCSRCQPYQTMVRNCSRVYDRICRGAVQVDLEAILELHQTPSKGHPLDTSQMQKQLAKFLGYSLWDLDQFKKNTSFWLQEDVFIQNVTCPPGQFIDVYWTCQNCSQCKPWEMEARLCESRQDRLCSGRTEITLGISDLAWLNESTLAALWNRTLISESIVIIQNHSLEVRQFDVPHGHFVKYETPYHYHYQPCTNCSVHDTIVRDCLLLQDRVCGGRVEIELQFENLTWLNLSTLNLTVMTRMLHGLLEYSMTPNDAITYAHRQARADEVITTPSPCPPDTFLVYDTESTWNCTPCQVCEANTSRQVRPCTLLHNRVCERHLVVDLEINTWPNITQVNFSFLEALLGRLLHYDVHPLDVQVKHRENITLFPNLIPCPHDHYLLYSSTTNWTCTPCQTCQSDQQRVARECSLLYDRVCRGSLDIAMDIQDTLYLNPGLLDVANMTAILRFLLRFDQLELSVEKTKQRENHTVIIEEIVCEPFYWLNLSSGACTPCSSCPLETYQTASCSKRKDTQCRACTQCTSREYEVCPCGPVTPDCPVGNRVCYKYPSWNISTWMAFQSRYHSSQLQDYIRTFLWFLQDETRSLNVTVVQHLETMSFTRGLIHNLTVNLTEVTGITTVAPDSSTVPSLAPLIERASYRADQDLAFQNSNQGMVNLGMEIKGSLFLNSSLLELKALELVLAKYIPTRQWNLSVGGLTQLIFEYVQRQAITCPDGQYLWTKTWECYNCTQCGVLWRPCSKHFDALCVGEVDVEIYVKGTHSIQSLNLANLSRLLDKLTGQMELGVNMSTIQNVSQGIDLQVQPYPTCPPLTHFFNVSRLECQICTVCSNPSKIRFPCQQYRDTVCMPVTPLEISLTLEVDKFIKSNFNFTGFVQKVYQKFQYEALYPSEVDISIRENHTVDARFVACPRNTYYGKNMGPYWICPACTVCLPWEREVRPCLVSNRLCQGLTEITVNVTGSNWLYDLNLTALGMLANALYNTSRFLPMRAQNVTQQRLHPMVVEPNSVDVEYYIGDAKRVFNQSSVFNSSSLKIQTYDVVDVIPNSVDIELNITGGLTSWAKIAENISKRYNFTRLYHSEHDSVVAVLQQTEISVIVQSALGLNLPDLLTHLDALHAIQARVIPVISVATQTVTGFFERNGTQYPMIFKTFQVEDNGTVQAIGYDIGGEFYMSGTVSQSNVYNMTKMYPGLYSMAYNGVKTQFNTIQGYWDLQGQHRGTFGIVFGVQTAQGRRRNLLSTDPNVTGCLDNTYLHWYDGLGYVCVPCNYDPTPGPVNQSTPNFRAYLWYYVANPCPPDAARICPGGLRGPSCITRTGVWTVNATDIITFTQPTCDPQFELVISEFLALCVGVVCQPGLTGQPGFCDWCVPGTYKPTIGSAECTLCDANTYSPAPGALDNTSCLACKAESRSDPGSSAPAQCLCNAGYFPRPNETCLPCPSGKYKFFPANVGCSACLSGSFASSQGQLHCDACLAGSFASTTGASLCQPCEPGTYNAYNRSGSMCPPCIAGTYSQSQQSTCVECPLNYISGLAAPACSKCPANTYANGTGLTTCLSCSPGLGLKNARYCLPCPGGSFSETGTCTPCSMGTYSTRSGATSSTTCIGCIAGTYTFSPGLTSCVLCPPGMVGLHCQLCEPGTYQPSYGKHSCISCARGEYSTLHGASSFFSCQNCERGKFWTSISHCQDCAAGTTSPPASLDESECFPAEGYYSDDERRALPCPANHYCTIGISTPIPCPEGLVSDVGSNTCDVPVEDVALWDWVVAALWSTVFILWVGCFWRYRRYWKRVVRL